MADLNDILVFVKVAQYESISRAARSLGMPVSTASRHLSALESQLGVTLLKRTTRRVSLTSEGREYFKECQEPLKLLEDAERVLTHSQQKPEGRLKISAPVMLGGESPFAEFVSGFLKTYPSIHIDLSITNVFVDLLADNVDVAIRFGEMRDSSVVAKRLGTSIRYLVAAPEYLKNRSLPAEPQDLEHHDCVLLNARSNEADWDLISGRKKARVHVSGPLSGYDFNTVSAFVYRGHGIGLLPSMYCDEAIARGQLTRVLPQWSSASIPIFAVYQSRKFLPLRLRLFLDALTSWKTTLWVKD